MACQGFIADKFKKLFAMSANDLKAKFEQDIKGATPKGTDTLRGNIRKRGSIPNIGPVSPKAWPWISLRRRGLQPAAYILEMQGLSPNPDCFTAERGR